MAKIWVLLTAALMLTTSCWKQLTYQPKPVLTENLADELERLMLAAEYSYRPVRVEVKPRYALFRYAVGSQSLTYADVDAIKLLESEEAYGVELLDRQGQRLLFVAYLELRKARQLVDVLTALTAPQAPAVGAPATSM